MMEPIPVGLRQILMIENLLPALTLDSVLSAGCVCKDNTQRGNKGIMEWSTPNPVSKKLSMCALLAGLCSAYSQLS